MNTGTKGTTGVLPALGTLALWALWALAVLGALWRSLYSVFSVVFHIIALTCNNRLVDFDSLLYHILNAEPITRKYLPVCT